ncbi:MAG: hypothetical protein ABI603_02665 [Acidobacteriota bacterium]
MTPPDGSGHLGDAEIELFCRHGLTAAALVSFADHVASCEACRGRVAAALDADRAEAALDAALGLPDRHVSEADVQAYVAGRLGRLRRRDVEAHAAQCRHCAEDIRDLQQFAREEAKADPRGRIGPWWYGGLAAAAILLAILLPGVFRTAPLPVLLALNDGPGRLQVDRRGAVVGLALPPGDAGTVRDAVLNRRLAVPEHIAALGRDRGELRGEAAEAPFRVLAPVATAVAAERPAFRWTPLADRTIYTVRLRDTTSDATITSPPLDALEWIPEAPLTRGHTYEWQVEAAAGGSDRIAPLPPDPPAAFAVLSADAAARLAAAPDSHLVRGILYANAGVLDAARRELEALAAQNPGSDTVRQWLADIDSAHRDSRRNP